MIRSVRTPHVLCFAFAALIACDGSSTIPTAIDAASKAPSARLSLNTARLGITPAPGNTAIWRSPVQLAPMIACTSTDPELTVKCSPPDNWNTYAGLTSGGLPVTVTIASGHFESYNVTCTPTGIITSCTPIDPNPWTPAFGQSQQTYHFSTTMTGQAGSGGIDVKFTNTLNSAQYSSGTVNLQAQWWKKVRVSPHTASVMVSANKDSLYTFTVSDSGMNTTAYKLTAVCTGTSSCFVDPSYKGTFPFTSTGQLSPFQTGSVRIWFHTTSTTPATVKLVAEDTSTSPCCITWPAILKDSGTVTVTH